MGLFSRILVAYDGSSGSTQALNTAVQLAGERGATLLVLSVIEHLPRYAATIGEVDEAVRQQTQALEECQRRAHAVAQEYGVTAVKTMIEPGHAAQLIVSVAERERVDLLVLGRSGHSEVWGRFMGSTADKITRHAPCSVLIAN
jgi:nucleotide-binding universal stress UspA family protein